MCIRVFFFKQKTAYDIGVRLVGSEMCIRDSFAADRPVYLCDGILYKILCIKRYLVKRSFELASWCHIL